MCLPTPAKKNQHLLILLDIYPKIYFYKNGDPAAKSKNDKIHSNKK